MSTPAAPSEPPAGDAEQATWLNTRERGTLLGIRAVFWLATAFGRWPARQLMRLIALYYALFDRTTKRASRDYWTRVTGEPSGFRTTYRHVFRFAQVALDRMFLLKGKTRHFTFTRTGNEHLLELAAKRQGAVLLGAHLGSYEAMRAGGDDEQLPVNIVGHFDNAKMINALFDRLNTDRAARVIHAEAGSVDFIFTIRERIEAGEMVALLGDRVGLNDNHVTVDFFGAPARFAAGPFLLASLLRCPVYLVFGLYYEPNRYELHCEPFTDRVILPRRQREAALVEIVEQFARRLEDYCRRAPDNWFNFYDFWGADDGQASDSSD